MAVWQHNTYTVWLCWVAVLFTFQLLDRMLTEPSWISLQKVGFFCFFFKFFTICPLLRRIKSSVLLSGATWASHTSTDRSLQLGRGGWGRDKKIPANHPSEANKAADHVKRRREGKKADFVDELLVLVLPQPSALPPFCLLHSLTGVDLPQCSNPGTVSLPVAPPNGFFCIWHQTSPVFLPPSVSLCTGHQGIL